MFPRCVSCVRDKASSLGNGGETCCEGAFRVVLSRFQLLGRVSFVVFVVVGVAFGGVEKRGIVLKGCFGSVAFSCCSSIGISFL